MANPDVALIADQLYRAFMAPLVIGGEMRPEKPIGGKVALEIGRERVAGDPDIVAHVRLARVRRARQLVAIDRVPDATEAEWALACALHDLVQSSHPDFDAAFKRRSAARLLDIVDATLDRIPAATTIGEALTRHTWFSRMWEIARTDTVVSWWVGKRTFLGTDPPARLTAWPDFRRVNVAKTPRTLLELPAHGGTVDGSRLAAVLSRFVSKTPLTDLATCGRAEPLFAWTPETLAVVATKGGATLTLRALARAPQAGVDSALGRATRQLVGKKAWGALEIALDLLAERAIAEALSAPGAARSTHVPDPKRDGDFARAAGALVARERVAGGHVALTEDDRRRVLAVLEPIAASSSADLVRAALAEAGALPAPPVAPALRSSSSPPSA